MPQPIRRTRRSSRRWLKSRRIIETAKRGHKPMIALGFFLFRF
jgi:hypothetical protein